MVVISMALLILSRLAVDVSAEVTVYTTVPGMAVTATTTATSMNAFYTANGAYSPLILNAPAPPTGLSNTININLQNGGMPGLSIPQKGNFLGFSIELSVVDMVLGRNASFLNVPFLNYMANIKERAGQGAVVRVGGNSQEDSVVYPDTFADSFGHLRMIQKYNATTASNPTLTPGINFAYELLYAMANISALVDTSWYFGMAFNDPANDTNSLQVATLAESILGDHLVAIQLGNEPDLYGPHGRRPVTYSIDDFFNEFGKVAGDLATSRTSNSKILLGPSVCCNWSIDDMLADGFMTKFDAELKVVGVMHYPANNCGLSGYINPQDIFPDYLTHKSAKTFASHYQPTSQQVVNSGRPYVMLETNTASCGGFPGVSDSFGSALWAIDNALMLAVTNFTTMLLHVGGQDDSYNPFTPPPTNLSTTKQWTTGPVYYSTLAVAETFGSSNLSQIAVLDLGNDLTPGYVVYESGVPTRLALLNYISDDTGTSDYNAVITMTGGQMPSQVSVRYLQAPSVSEKFDITWANQTLGGQFGSDGRMIGTQQTVTVECDETTNTCTIPVRAPSFALIFLSDSALVNSGSESPASTVTFATTAYTNHNHHPILDPSVLATMNGHGGPGPRYMGSTTKGKDGNNIGGSVEGASISRWAVLAAVLAGGFVLGGRMGLGPVFGH